MKHYLIKEQERIKGFSSMLILDRIGLAWVFKQGGARVHARSFSECSSTQERKVR